MTEINAGTYEGTIAGYFEDESNAQRAVQELQEAGFSSAHLGVAHRGGSSSSYTGTAASGSGRSSSEHANGNGPGMWEKIKDFFEGKSTEDATEDAGRRSVRSSATDDPYANYAGSDYEYDESDVHRSLTGMSIPEERSKYFGHRFGSSSSGALVTVRAGERATEAEAILRRNGGDLGDEAASYDYSNTSGTVGGRAKDRPDLGAQAGTTEPELLLEDGEDTGRTQARGVPGQSAGVQGGGQDRGIQDSGIQGVQKIQLLGEVLRVHTERVGLGEVRIRKEVVTEQQTVQVPVTHEELVIERQSVSGERPADGTIGQNGKGDEIRIPLSEERASVDKSTVVREEVAVGKKPVQDVRNLSGDVRHEELVVDDERKEAQRRPA